MANPKPGGAGQLLRRFFMPRFVVTLWLFLRNRSKVSLRAEVDFTKNLKLGPRSVVGSFTKIKATRGVFSTGVHCQIATGCFISASYGGIRMGDHVMCGPNVTIVSGGYKYERLDVPFSQQEQVSKGVVIGDNVWIGAGTSIVDGSVVGDNTVIVANSLINRRYPSNCILQGNPARIVLRRKTTEEAGHD